ncbi:MAG: MFS transporter [Polyangiaceae bacterium]
MQVGGLSRTGGGASLGIRLSAFLLAFDASANGYVIQYWQERLGLGARLASWFLGAYILGELAGAPLGGYLAARWGAARAFRRSALLFALGAALSGSNLSLGLALLGRVLQGVSAGPLLPLAAVLICEHTPAERQGRQLSILSIVYGVAFLIGIASVPYLLRAGYGWLFALEIGAASVCFLRAPSSRAESSSKGFDTSGLICFMVALSLLAVASNTVTESAWVSGAALALGAAALMVFHRVERRAEDAMLPVALWARPRAVPLLGAAIGSGFGQALVVALPTLAALKLGVRAEQTLSLLYPLIAGGLGAGVASAIWLDRVGARLAAGIGALACLAASALLAWSAETRLTFCAATLALGLGTSALSGGALRHAVTQTSEPELMSRAQAALGLFTNVGVLLGGALFGALTAQGSTRAIAAQVAVAFGAAMLLAFLPVPRLPSRNARGQGPVV